MTRLAKTAPGAGARRAWAASAAAILLTILVAAAPGRARDEPETALSGWLAELRRTEAALLEERWEEAAERSRTVVEDMVGRLKSGDDSARLLALAVVQQALGEAGAGRLEDAVWHFQAAQNLDPGFRSASLERFGAAGRAITAHRLRQPGTAPAGSSRLEEAGSGIVPPRLLESPTIVFRASARVLSEFDRSLRVEVIIDEEGRIRSPVVSGSRRNPAPILASLEALRGWRFAPATRAGSPVAVLYEIDLPVTRGAAERVRLDLERRLEGRDRPPGQPRP